jgi:integrase
MPRIKLTERSIARLAAPTASGKQVVFWDLDLRGFGVLVSGRTTVKSFIAQRDLQGGRTRRVTIAHVNELPLAEAKERARKLLVDMRAGKDPKQKSGSGTLQETADLYLQSARLSPRTREIYGRLVRVHLASPANRPLGTIVPAEIDALHNRIAGKAVANAAIKVLRLLYNWAAARDDSLPRNPCRLRGNEWHSTTPKRRPIATEKLADFYAAVQTLPPMLKDYVLLLLFTGMRRREGAALRWSEVDFERGLIHLPSARTKTRKPLDTPMCDVVRDLLVARRQLGDGTFVFPSYGASGHLEHVGAAVQMLREKTGIEFSTHDLRRTFITVAEALDISPYAIKALVNHALGTSVTDGYISMSVERLRGPAQQVADRLKLLCGMAAASGNVTALRLG